MEYFVHSVDGQTYGPADLATLQLWANEGRVLPDTTLTERETGRVLRAGDLGGLSLRASSQPVYAQAPGTYGGHGGTGPRVETAWPLAKAILSLLLCCLPLGIVATVYAAQASSNASAGLYELAHENIRKANAWSNASIIIGLVFGCLYLALMFLPLMMGMN